MSAPSSSSQPHIPWRSRWDSAMSATAPERPTVEEVIPVVHGVVDQILEGPGVNKSRIGTVIRKGATLLAQYYGGHVPENWNEVIRAPGAAELIKDEIDRIFPLIYGEILFCVDDAGLDYADGARELAGVLSTRIIKTILKLTTIDEAAILFDGFIKVLATCNERSQSAMSIAPSTVNVSSAQEKNDDRVNIKDLPLIDGGEWGLAKLGVVSYDTWQYRIRLACSSYALRGRRACYYALRNLCGAERTYAHTCLTKEIPEGTEPLDYLLQRLQEEYGSVWSHGRARQQFQQAKKQSNESVVSFMSRLKSMAVALPGKCNVSEGELRQRFLDGIPPGLLAKIKSRYGPKIYEKKLESIVDSAEFFDSEYQQGRDTVIGRKGGGARPRFPENGKPQARDGGRQENVDRQFGKGNAISANLSNVYCYNCGKAGHFKRNCPDLSRNGGRSPSTVSTSGVAGEAQKPKGPGSPGKSAQPTGSVEVFVGEVRGVYAIGADDPVPKLACKFGQHAEFEADVLLDSGAASSLMADAVASQLIASNDACLRELKTPVKLSYAGAAEEVSHQEVIVPVQLERKTGEWFYLPFIVVKGSSRGILLGRSAMCCLNITLKFAGDSAENEQLRNVYEQASDQRSEMRSVAEEEKIDAIYVHIDQVIEEPSVIESSHPFPNDYDADRSEMACRGMARIILVMDDYLFVGSSDEIAFTESLYDCLWSRCGFNCSSEKRALWSADSPIRWLGAYWSFDADIPKLTMKRPVVERELHHPYTKRQIFSAAGVFLALTGGFCETLARAHADTLRRLSGGWADWDSPCQDSHVCNLLSKHFDCAKFYWKASSAEDENLRIYGSITDIEVRTDASKVGYGFVVVDRGLVDGTGNIYNSSAIVYSEAKGFNKKQDVWHCNRKELYGLAMCIRRLDTLLVLMPHLRSIRVGTDSRVTQKQSDPWALTSGSKALEKQAILRLRNMIIDLNFDWRRRSIRLEICHVIAAKNIHADMLSRAPEMTICIPVEKPEGEMIAPIAVEPTGETSSDSDNGVTVESSQNLGACDYGIGNDLLGWSCFIVPSYRRFVGLQQIFGAWRSTAGQSAAADDKSPDNCNGSRLQWLRYEQVRDAETNRAREALNSDPSLGEKATGFVYRLFLNKQNLLCRRILLKSGEGRKVLTQVVVPRRLMSEIAEAAHHQAAHAAFYEVSHKIAEVAWCPGMKKIIKQTVNACEPCQRSVVRPSDIAEETGGIGVPSGPFRTVGIDLYGPMRSPRVGMAATAKTEPPWYVVTFVCRYTGFTCFRLIPDCRGSTVVTEVEKVIVWQWGNVTDLIITDQGSQFCRHPGFSSLLLMNAMRHEVLPSRSPHLGGFYEVKHKVLGRCLRSMLQNAKMPDWELMLCIAANRINNSTPKDGAPSPFELVYGYSPKLPIARLLTADDNAAEEWERLRPKFLPSDPLHNAQVIADCRRRIKRRDHMLGIFREFWLDRRQHAAVESSKKSTGTQPLEAGDIVLITKDRNPKLGQYVRDEKYEIIGAKGKQCYSVKPVDGGAPMIVHAKNLRRFFTHDEDDPHVEEDHPTGDSGFSDEEPLAHGEGNPDSKVLDDAPHKGGEDHMSYPLLIDGTTESQNGTATTTPRRSKRDHERHFLEAIQGSTSRYGRSRRGRKL